MDLVKLHTDKPYKCPNPTHKTIAVPYGLQFYKSNHPNAILWHTVRYMSRHTINGEITHTSVGMWCGQNGFTHKGKMSNKATRPICQCCAKKYNQFLKRK
jgi:hypothetical protein